MPHAASGRLQLQATLVMIFADAVSMPHAADGRLQQLRYRVTGLGKN